MEKSNKKTLSDYAETLFRKQQLSEMTVEEIESELVYMINNKGTGKNWYRTAVFVYNMGGTRFVKVCDTFIEATGYKKSALQNFKMAGQIIRYDKLTEQDVGDKTINEFLDLVKMTPSGYIIKVEKIGEYMLRGNEYYLYQGEFGKHTIYFRSDIVINGNIEVRVSITKDKHGKENEVKEFFYNNEKIKLSNFEPIYPEDVNLKRA